MQVSLTHSNAEEFHATATSNPRHEVASILEDEEIEIQRIFVPVLVSSWHLFSNQLYISNNQRCRLVVLAIEAWGRSSEEAAAFVSNFARTTTRQPPAIVQQRVATALTARWSATLTPQP